MCRYDRPMFYVKRKKLTKANPKAYTQIIYLATFLQYLGNKKRNESEKNNAKITLLLVGCHFA